MTEDSKTYVFDSASRNSLDPNTLLAMIGNNGGFGGNGNLLWVIFLFFLYGWGGNGMFGNRGMSGLAGEINGDYGRTLLMQAINGNGNAISQLSCALNCSTDAIQNAINQVQTNIQQVGSQVGMSSQAVINAIQSGNASIASQLSQCCCDNKLLITTQGYENRIANSENTSLLGAKIDAQTIAMNNQFCALKEREMQSKIDALLEKNSTLEATISNANQTAQIQQYIASVVSPLAADVAAIKAAQPNTVSIPYPQLTAIPTASLYGYGINTGSIWS